MGDVSAHQEANEEADVEEEANEEANEDAIEDANEEANKEALEQLECMESADQATVEKAGVVGRMGRQWSELALVLNVCDVAVRERGQLRITACKLDVKFQVGSDLSSSGK